MPPAKRAKKATSRQVRVRMYRHGLGDCFLLSFPRAGARTKPFHMLIDCGVIIGTTDAKKKMQQVAKDVAKTTGKRLDLLVVTHEHADHVSGFLQAATEFGGITIDQVWLAWTEDPEDPVARKLRQQREQRAAALRAALDRVDQSLTAAPDNPRAERMTGLAAQAREVMGFFEIGAAPAGSTVAAAMDWLRDQGAKFRRPGEPPLTFDGVAGVRVFVLGPPTDLKKLFKDLPTKTGQETYEVSDLAVLSASADAFCTAAGLAGDAESATDPFQPFDRRVRLTTEQVRGDLFFQRHYGFEPGGADAWRRIDFDWMAAAAEFALKLDSDTNNTSLVLAIELPDGRVLLFPGDAQVGNWESWHDLTWTEPDGRKVTAADLLGRTVLYKVGHHGSHNATLRAKGLELMSHPDLVAMVPVDEKVAHDKKHWTRMPFVPLMERLAEKTHGCVLRSDLEKDKMKAPAEATAAEVARFKKFLKGVKPSTAKVEAGRALYFDCTVPL